MSEISRRDLFRSVGAVGAATALPAAANAQQPQPAAPSVAAWRAGQREASRPSPFKFFNPAEAAFVTAAVDRLIPSDDDWPGAVWADVPNYIDGQLAGAYGSGAGFYASGPWKKGLPSQGYQLPLNPSQLYRTSLAAISRELQGRRLDFPKAAPAQQDAFLRELEDGRLDLGGFPSSQFFETLLANTIEGFLSDPSYGGNRDMVGWRMIGFPGAYAAYLNIYTAHGQKFDREPMSIASHAHGSRTEHDHG